MGKKIEINPGTKFNNLTIIEEVEARFKKRHFKCRCDCGNIIITQLNHLKSGHTKSCGCLQEHHGMSNTRIYKIWKAMKKRCDNKNSSDYYLYGGRGITYDPKWKLFSEFYKDMGGSYKDGLSIDRIDNNLGYNKENCRRATNKEQANNRRNNHIVYIDGEKMTMANAARKLGVKYTTFRAKTYREGP